MTMLDFSGRSQSISTSVSGHVRAMEGEDYFVGGLRLEFFENLLRL